MTGAWADTRPNRARLAGLAARTAGYVAWDRVARRRVRSAAEIPPSPAAITPEWLTAVLCRGSRARVRSATVTDGSSGTSVRARLRLEYEGEAERLPAGLFAKTTPSVVTRLANGASGTSPAEGAFYRELRPKLPAELEIPVGYHSAADPRSFRSIQLIEDLGATKDATFGSPALNPTIEQAEAAVDLLAAVHSAFRDLPRPPWMSGYRHWWTRAMGVADVHRPTRAYLARSECPATLRARALEVWPAFARSVALHDELPATVLHSDPHVANWYITGSGQPGLCDWQCVCHGHWSLDVAYALCTILPVEARRAWERGLLARYLEAAKAEESFAEAWLRYRQQLPGALLKWTAPADPPRGLPAMQPTEVSSELLARIATAMADLDSLDALAQ